ncbi:MAG: hypothetical protein ABJQ29_15975 [Luteolibacter sp.]
MKTIAFILGYARAVPRLLAILGGLIILAAAPLHADLFVTNFTMLNDPEGATGKWRNLTTATDLGIPVSISQDGGRVRPDDGSSTESVIDDTFPWQPLPPIAGGANAFSPNFDGDYINIETDEGSKATIVLEFNAMVTDPVISFTDIEERSTMAFTIPFTVIASTSNLSATSTTLTSTGDPAADDAFMIFGEEAAGSIQFTGIFERIEFTVDVMTDPAYGPNDRTGYVVSTMTEPVPVLRPINVAKVNDQIVLTWILGMYDAIEMSDPSVLSGFEPIIGLDPQATDSYSADISVLGDSVFFRGVRNDP